MALPAVIDLRVTGRCNLSCPFCFGPRHTVDHNQIDEFVRLMGPLAANGVRRIVVTGGEPLLVPRLGELLHSARSESLECILSTNGSLLRRRHQEVLPFLDWIALPVESVDPILHGLLRPEAGNLFANVGNRQLHELISCIRLIRGQYPEVGIKLGTVATRLNASSVAEIPGWLTPLVGIPDTWKVYQVTRSSYGEDNWRSLSLSNRAFDECVASCTAAAAHQGWHAVFHKARERSGKYLFCEPNGDALVVSGGKEIVIGNFFVDFRGVLEAHEPFVDRGRLEENAFETYPVLESDRAKGNL